MPVETLEFEDGGAYVGETKDGIPHGKVFLSTVSAPNFGRRRLFFLKMYFFLNAVKLCRKKFFCGSPTCPYSDPPLVKNNVLGPYPKIPLLAVYFLEHRQDT